MREVLAGLGVAIGVALVFSVLVANQSIGRSAEQVIDSLAGSAQLQVEARSPNGMPQTERFSSLSGVAHTAPVVEGSIGIESGGHFVSTQIIGAGLEATRLNPFAAAVPITGGGVLLPTALATQLHVPRGRSSTVTVLAAGRAVSAPVQAVLGPETIGPLASSTVLLAPLYYAQSLLGLHGRVTNVLVSVQPGREREVRMSLKHAAEGMTVESATADDGLLRRALAPQNQATTFFALVGGLIGALLIVTAMLLSFGERRLMLAELRLEGFKRWELRQIVFSQAAVLGAVASFVGVLGGYALAVGAWRSNPAYLAGAFPLGAKTIVPVTLAMAVWAGGVLLTCVAASPVLVGAEIANGRKGRATLSASTERRMLIGAGALVLFSGASSLTPSTSLLAALFLAFGLLLAIPACLHAITRLGEIVGARVQSGALTVAVRIIKATPIQSAALVATAAMGVFGAIVAEGAHGDLLHGLERGYAQYVSSADVWVTNKGDDLATRTFPARNLEYELSRTQGVRGVRPYYGGWVDIAGRRTWLISKEGSILPPGQVLHGGPAAARRLQEGGWVALSDQLARALHVGVGGTVTLPTPSGPAALRLAATTTNLGWSSGVIMLSARTYTRYWGHQAPTALEVDAAPSALAAISRTVPVGLVAQRSAERAAVANALPRQGLVRLSEIALLLVIAAAVATATALAAAVWERRMLLASLGLDSFKPSRIRAILAWEATLVVGAGAALGAIAGVYGHVLADRYLAVSTGYPVSFALSIPQVAGALALVAVVTALVLALPGYVASRVSPALALDGS